MHNQTLTIMGGEGHMLDMIKKLELNRTQRKDIGGGRFRSHKRPRITEEYLRNMKSVEIEKQQELSVREKRMYQVLAITAFALIFGFVVFLLILFFRHAHVLIL